MREDLEAGCSTLTVFTTHYTTELEKYKAYSAYSPNDLAHGDSLMVIETDVHAPIT